MKVETIVKDVKGAVEPYMIKGQDMVTVSVETVKQANTIVVDSVQTLFKNNVNAGKDLISVAQSSFEKAKAAGVKEVASKPVEYLPEGKDLIVDAYKDSYSIVTKAGEQLVTVVRKGFEDVSAKLSGSSTVSGEVKKAKATVRKTANKAAKAAKKTTA